MYKLFVFYMANSAEERKMFFEEVKAAGIIEATRNEEGCILYDYFFSAEREGEILLVENWKSREAQELHDSLPHLIELGKIKEKYGIRTRIEEF